ncbi:MAG: secondary thiamine-phosphate synthase enzyme YjbQ [Lachnospiraceae bacterium]|jgi:secondary thiamine-phosphate synthase enzyme|nr:secondary thiamine-phosphate synthase enzyme YjbQ [Lachnospiraceae bacterium]MCI1727264.1 secondary thiamine-phosphate synthase enzyme YjbQ [Lachnospiraceae bacterium]
MNLFKHQLAVSEKEKMISITEDIREDVRKSGIISGLVTVFCPHTTAGITINENTDPDVQHDFLYGYSKVFPTYDNEYLHEEGNSYAHMKSSAVGASQNIILEDGRLVLGIWQDIYFCEFDGPRNRNYYVKIIEG